MGDMTHLRLLDLPHEVLHGIIVWVAPTDLSRLSFTCKTFAEIIRHSPLLWRAVYLNSYDEAPSRDSRTINWRAELQEVVSTQKLLASEDTAAKRQAFTQVCNTAIKIVKHARGDPPSSSKNIKLLKEAFTSVDNQNIFLCSSSLFSEAGNLAHTPADTEEDRQLSAKLHCLYGAPRWGWATTDDTDTHPYARARVYDLRRYTVGTFWGPFMDDGSQNVDWEKLEAIITVLGYSLKSFHDRTNGFFPEIWIENVSWFGASPYSWHSGLAQRNARKVAEHPSLNLSPPNDDPFCVTGTWMRIVCFLDYREFFHFNFRQSRPPLEEDMEPLDAEEAIRLIIMLLEVDRIEAPGETEGKDYPIVHFKGTSRAMRLGTDDPNANSSIIGSVRQTPEGEIRWTTFSVYSGEARWRSEGIQVGGIQSARGVIGNWFDKDFDPHGPAGPTAFWKVSDKIEGAKVSHD